MLHEIRLRLQRSWCWLFGHKNRSGLRKDRWDWYYIHCYDCEEDIHVSYDDNVKIDDIEKANQEENKLISEIMDEKEKSEIKIMQQQRRDGVFAKQKRDKNARKKIKRT